MDIKCDFFWIEVLFQFQRILFKKCIVARNKHVHYFNSLHLLQFVCGGDCKHDGEGAEPHGARLGLCARLPGPSALTPSPATAWSRIGSDATGRAPLTR